MGIVDLAFNKKSTHLAISCMDSVIKVVDLISSTLSHTQNSSSPSSATSWRTGK